MYRWSGRLKCCEKGSTLKITPVSDKLNIVPHCMVAWCTEKWWILLGRSQKMGTKTKSVCCILSCKELSPPIKTEQSGTPQCLKYGHLHRLLSTVHPESFRFLHPEILLIITRGRRPGFWGGGALKLFRTIQMSSVESVLKYLRAPFWQHKNTRLTWDGTPRTMAPVFNTKTF